MKHLPTAFATRTPIACQELPMKLRSLLALVLLSLTSGSALAGTAVPEPGVLELLAISGIVGAAIAIRNRRK